MITLRPTRQLYSAVHTDEKPCIDDGLASQSVNAPPVGTCRKRMPPPALHPRRSLNVHAATRAKTAGSASTGPRTRTSYVTTRCGASPALTAAAAGAAG